MREGFLFSTFSFIFYFIFLNTTIAQVKIDITRGRVEPMPIAVVPFSFSDKSIDNIEKKISSVISNDLERSGLFRPIKKESFVQTLSSFNSIPRFPDWRVLNAQALIQGEVNELRNGQIRVSYRLWDVFIGQQLKGQAFVTPKANWRRVSHIIADSIYQEITGESGYFDTRIVYISESGPLNSRIKRLAIMDQDEENHRFLTDGKALVLTPRFSPTTQEITYLSFFNDLPRVYLFNLETGKQEILGDFPGMTYAPRFSPSAKKIIFSMASSGNSDIYEMDLRSRRTLRLTSHPAIDTSPSYSPDNRKITFNSDRGGSQQIYVMSIDGTSVRRISFGKGRYATPVWSPRGDLIAFTKIRRGKFYIGVMETDGSGERLLAQGFLVESPTWAPNGRVLMYFAQEPSKKDGSGGKTRLFSIDLTGYNQMERLTPTDASDPAWSPLIP